MSRRCCNLSTTLSGLLVLIGVGCAAPDPPTPSSLYVTTRGELGAQLQRYDWRFDRRLLAQSRWELAPTLTHITPFSNQQQPLQPLLALDDQETLVAAPSVDGLGVFAIRGSRTPRRLFTPLDLPPVREILEIAADRVLLRCAAAPRTATLSVRRGLVAALHPVWSRLALVDTAADAVSVLLDDPVQPLARVGPLDWLLLVQRDTGNVVTRFNVLTGDIIDIAPWPADRRIAGAVVGEHGDWAAIAFQMLGREWHVFDVVVWRRGERGLQPLVQDVRVTTRPRSPIGPALRLTPLTGNYLALVYTEVTEWRGLLPTDGRYLTGIANVQTGEMLVKIPHPSAGLLDAIPPAHLPADALQTLRIPIDSRAAPWRRFLDVTDGRLTAPGGRTFVPGSLSEYTYAAENRALAARYNAPTGRETVVVFVDQQPPIELNTAQSITGLSWVRSVSQTPDSVPEPD